VIGEKGAPGLRWRLARRAWHQARNLAFGDPDAELEQLTVDARGAPQSVRVRHLPNEVAGAAIDWRAPGCSAARTPGPEPAEGGAMPANNCGGLYDQEGVAPAESRSTTPPGRGGPPRGVVGECGDAEGRRVAGGGRDSRGQARRAFGPRTWLRQIRSTGARALRRSITSGEAPPTKETPRISRGSSFGERQVEAAIPVSDDVQRVPSPPSVRSSALWHRAEIGGFMRRRRRTPVIRRPPSPIYRSRLMAPTPVIRWRASLRGHRLVLRAGQP
jgi:hypothetical protein